MLLIFGLIILGAGDGSVANFEIKARMGPEPVGLHWTRSFEVDIQVEGEINGEFTLNDKEGLRPILLFLDVPESIRLVGAPADEKTPDALQAMFLDYPYGRRLTTKQTRIAFRYDSLPKPGDAIGIIAVTYLKGSLPGDAVMVRRRLQLELHPSAEATPGDANDFSWGIRDTLKIGQKATPFKLPMGNEALLESDDFLGKKRSLIITYRGST